MTPALVLSSLMAGLIYLYFGIDMVVNGETSQAIFWFLVWGHILSALVAAIITIPLLAILAVFAAAAAGLFSLAFGLQKKGVESLPFKVERKDTTTPLTEQEAGIQRLLDHHLGDTSLPWREH